MKLKEFIEKNRDQIANEMVAAGSVGNDHSLVINPSRRLQIMQDGFHYRDGQINLGSADNKAQALEHLDALVEDQWFPDLEERFSGF